MLKTILFDVDGTLIDTEEIIIQSLQETLEKELDLTKTAEELKFVLGIPGKEAVKQLVETERDYFLEQWSLRLDQLSPQAKLFDQVKSLLEELKKMDYNLGVVTSKTKNDMDESLDRFQLHSYFDAVVTTSDTKKHKPNAAPILKALEIINEEPEHAMYVGDSVYDFLSAQNSGVQFALAEWGAQEHEEFAKVKIHLEEPTDLIDHLKEN